jgi:hypothetical protein
MSSSSNTSIAKKAHTKAEADFATWLMMAKLGGFDDLPSNAHLLTNYRTRLETMSEAESTALAFARSTALITAGWEAWARRRNAGNRLVRLRADERRFARPAPRKRSACGPSGDLWEISSRLPGVPSGPAGFSRVE